MKTMPKIESIHPSKQPRRPHFIKEWAEKRGLTQADLVKELGVDKGTVSRWYSGSSPSKDMQEILAEFFGCEPDGLFRHPEEDWLAKFLRDRPKMEIDRIKATLEAAFPRKNGTNGG